ncbi:MAG: P-loop NTPase [Chlamydiales bacterium]|nr:P-loop NTPase [Chlamydiales bacterium]NCF70282.1 P-loop NTPase [Chlamydiales bacterium]
MSLNMFPTQPQQGGLHGVGQVIAVVSGKGGVGKSTVCASLALSLKSKGFNVGVLDADLYGPSMEVLLPKDESPKQMEKGIQPAVSKGIRLVSMAYLKPNSGAAVVRAPIANQLLRQFVQEVFWGDLDYLLIDFPPGTGDIQLTLAQQVKIDGAILVTQPQKLSLIDVEKAADMLQMLNVPVLGVVKNMGHFIDSDGKSHSIFSESHSESLERVPTLASLPLSPLISELCDSGKLHCYNDKESGFTKEIDKVVAVIEEHAKREKSAFKFRLDGEGHLLLSFDDGIIKQIHLSDIQKSCACSQCQEHSIEVDPDVNILSIERVGNYALQFSFSSGCSKGLYKISDLEKLAKVPLKGGA